MRVLVAPDKFRGAATAAQVGAAIAAGLRQSDLTLDVEVLPIADGGEGTLDAALAAGFIAHVVPARGPVGDRRDARIGLRVGGAGGITALVELAEICGMAHLPGGVLRPLEAHTGGLGDALRAALDLGADELILAVGGSASTDAGLGALIALGARVLDANGRDVPPGAGHLGDVRTIDLTALHPGLRAARIQIATDVSTPLLGALGSVAMFGPQKGITDDLAPGIEAGMRAVACAVRRAEGLDTTAIPGGGAAGGIAATFAGLLGAQIVPGATFVIDLLGARARMADADLVITGEGAFDEQTLHGKGPGAILELAREQGIATAVIAGRIDVDDRTLGALGVAHALALTSLTGGDVDAAIADCLGLAQRAGAVIGAVLAAAWPGSAAGGPLESRA